MLRKLYEAGCFDYQKFILNNLKALSLKNDEALVLIKVINNYSINKGFSSDLIASSINEKRDTVEKALASLLERGFFDIYVDYDNGLGKECISIDGFFNKCKAVLESNTKTNKDEMFLVSQLIKTKLNRIPTSNELDIISSLVNEDRYTLSNFEDAFKYLEEKKKPITMRQLVNALTKVNKPEEKKELKTENKGVIMDFFSQIK